jgi:hypothetical protein
MEVATYALTLLVFIAIYAYLHVRAGRPPVQWGWLAAIVVCAAAALALGALL